ncbi:MerR family DNA-binding transcriptional regulator, partial [Streptomyces sp. NPDC006992]|uniref:MerR family DNA-binding transcriptional regulator n=1 Tax=Streptomyces sp. NPDC006992 TaxID=3155601 RepID=UPI0033E7C0CF
MGQNLQSTGRLRPVDLARGHGLSTQAVRNYEADGILPPAGRTDHGYRTYTPLHAQALRAFLALLPGHGHRTAASILRAVNEDAVEEALRLVAATPNLATQQQVLSRALAASGHRPEEIGYLEA